jgi:hypothetical protein
MQHVSSRKHDPAGERYVVKQLGDNRCDVVHIGPYVVAKDLKLKEALALAAALNQESKDR